MAPRFLLLAAVLLASSGVAACSSEPIDDESPSEDELTTSVLGDKAALFSQDLLYVRIESWDSRFTTPASLREERTTQGAKLSVYVANPKSAAHCPDAEANERTMVYTTKEFSLRTSGNMTNGTPKSSYKVGLESKRDRLFGMSALNLKSMWNDVSQMREALAWRIFGEARVPAPRHTYAKLCVNGKYYGVFSMIEQVDKEFLKDRFGENDDGNLYKAYWPKDDIGPATLERRKDASGDDSGKQYKKQSDIDERTYQLKTNDKSDDPADKQSYDDLAGFVRAINPSSNAYDTDEFASKLEATFDVKTFLRWAAVNSLLGAWDNYWATPANYYVYNAGHRADPKAFMSAPYFVWIPWDYDNTFGIDFHDARWQNASIVDFPSATRPYYRGESVAKLPLLEHTLGNKKFLRYYLDAIEHLNDTVFTEAWVTKQIGDSNKGIRARIESAVYQESDSPTGAAHTGRQWTNDEVFRHGFEHNETSKTGAKIDGIKHFVKMRHDSVAQQLGALRRSHPKGSSGERFPTSMPSIP